MRVALLFIDGVGVGPPRPDTNPLTRGHFLLSRFDDGSGSELPAGVELQLADTTFGVEGRPQSASNQTAILTGLDAPAIVGRHILGYPTPALAALLAESSVPRQLAALGRSVTFANAYPAEYLDALALPRRAGRPEGFTFPDRARRHLKASATTLAMQAGGVPLRTFDDARAGAGLTHDVDGRHGRRRGLALPSRTAEEAASIFWSLAEDFTLFEHLLADEAGHAQDLDAALDALGTFDSFARAVLAARPDDAAVFIVSDHGNVEDLSTRNHTRNPVAVLAAGAPAGLKISTVADVGRVIVSLLSP